MYAIRIIIYIAAVIASFFSFVFCEAWVTMLLMLAVIVMPLLSGLLGLLGARKISYRVSAVPSVRCGDRLDILVYDTGGVRTLNYTVDLAVDKGFDEEKVWSVSLFDGIRKSSFVETTHCCTIRISVKNAYAYDALGLFRLRLRPVSDTVVCVMPYPQPPEELPEYSLAMHESYVPKYGGGFAEVHDMRPYRPGDSMRDIHWKLSAKTGQMIVREPQRPVCSSIVITIDLEAPSAELDRRIANLLWVSDWLIRSNVEHDVCWLDPVDRQVKAFNVTGATDPVALVREMLVKRVTRPLPSIADMPVAKADWHYHIGGEVQQ